MLIKGKVALVTGGASGIGLGIVKKFLANGAKGVAIVDVAVDGAKVVDKISEYFGPNKAIYIKTDITRDEDLEKAFEKTVATFNQLDLVINCAGVFNETSYRKVVDTNLTAVICGSFLAMMKFLPKFKSTDEAIIVNISSIAGLQPMAHCPAYGATKAGVVSFGKALGSKEFFDKYNVKILTVCPGAVDTPLLLNSSRDKDALFFPHLVDEFLKNCVTETPESMAEGVVQIIADAPTGSIWVKADRKPIFQVNLPSIETMKI